MSLNRLSQKWGPVQSKAIAVADKAIKAHPKVYEFRAEKVYAKRQAGFDFHGGLHREKAERMWAEAVEDVKQCMKPPDELGSGDRRFNASMYCTMVICLDMLSRFRERDSWMERWEQEHPDDPQIPRQKTILSEKDARRGRSAWFTVASQTA